MSVYLLKLMWSPRRKLHLINCTNDKLYISRTSILLHLYMFKICFEMAAAICFLHVSQTSKLKEFYCSNHSESHLLLSNPQALRVSVVGSCTSLFHSTIWFRYQSAMPILSLFQMRVQNHHSLNYFP